MEPTWENPEKMNGLLGIEGSKETYAYLMEVISKLELQVKDGRVFASYNRDLPIIKAKIQLEFLDPKTGLIYDHLISVVFEGEPFES